MTTERLLRFNPEPTPIWHGIPRIHGKMEQDLFESFAINFNIHRRIFYGQVQVDAVPATILL